MKVSPLLILDCDSTAIQDEVIELIAKAAGTQREVSEITAQAMRGEIDFAASLQARVATLAGVSSSVFGEVFAQLRITPGLAELIAAVHQLGGAVGIVSGGFHEVLDPLAQQLGIDHWRANRLEVFAGKLTGCTRGPVIDAAAKATALKEWAALRQIPLAHTIAVGDGANDLQMMSAAGISVAFNAKAIVREQAQFSLEDSLAGVIPLLKQLGK